MASDQAELSAVLTRLGIARGPHEAVAAAVRALSRHGDLALGLEALGELADLAPRVTRLDRPAPEAELLDQGPSLAEMEATLRRLGPWRKGPFSFCRSAGEQLVLDAEWRSDLKWERVRALSPSLTGKHVLDVGTGNGYFLLRLRGAGAVSATGLEPSLRSVLQFLAIEQLYGADRCALWPLRLEDLPPSFPCYDTVMSMGVLYHQRNPIQHLEQLRALLASEGELILETIVLPGDASLSLEPAERYAGMRNVYQLPTLPLLRSWLLTAGFELVALGDAVVVTSDEQRQTSWSEGPSLEQFLEPTNGSPDDPGRKTREGHERPTRVVLRARPMEPRA